MNSVGDARGESAWPIVARDDEVRRALASLQPDSEFRGVALVGDNGVGKSILTRTLGDSLTATGQTVRFVLGTQSGRDVPLGAFCRSVTIEAVHEPAAMLAAAHKSLEELENLVIVVDDAHQLDPLSATLIYQLAMAGTARLIVTIRQSEPILDAVTALLKERLLLNLHVDAFTEEQTGELAHQVLGGVIGPEVIARLHSRSGGNPLLLRGLLRAGRETGVLVPSEDGWHLHGPLRADRELTDLLEFRLRSLAADELEALEILASAELLDYGVLRELCDPEAVSGLERRHLIQLVADGSDTVVRLTHPVVGEAAIRLAGMARARQLNGFLVRAYQKYLRAGGRRLRLPDLRGRIRMAQLMMHSDLTPDLDLILAAARSATALSNLAHAEELARFAFDRGGGPPAALALAEALVWQGRCTEAEAVLVAVDPIDADDMVTVRWGCVRATNLFWNHGELEAAYQILTEVTGRIDSEAGSALVHAVEVAFAFFAGDLETAIVAGLPLCSSDGPPLVVAWAAVPTTLALAKAGRFDDVRRIAKRGLKASVLSESGPVRFGIGIAEVVALLAAGNHPEAERVVERYTEMAAGMPEASAMVGVLAGRVHLAHGDLPSACSAFQQSVPALSNGAPSPWPTLAWAWLAQAEGARGNAEAAAAALHSCEAGYGPQFAAFLPDIELARAWWRAAAGQTSTGQTHALRAAQIAHRSGMRAIEMTALHTAVRFGDRSQAGRLAELAGALNTPLAEAVAVHASALADHDGDLLDDAADRFWAMGALALAADAAAQAAAEHTWAGRRGKELESSSRAQWLAGQGEIRTPAVTAIARPLPITHREREIAMLVATGLSNRQIANQLSVSVRTIDGHLYRVFAKLGIQRRDQLVRLFAAGRPQT